MDKFIQRYNQMLSDQFDFKAAIDHLKENQIANDNKSQGSNIAKGPPKRVVSTSNFSNFNSISTKKNPQRKLTTLIPTEFQEKTVKFNDVLEPMINPNGGFAGFSIRPDLMKTLFMKNNFTIDKMKRLLKVVIYLNRIL